MSNAESVAMAAVASVFAACVFAMGIDYGTDTMKAEAIKHGHAEYSQKTGKWQWKEHTVKQVEESK